ncbi:MAG: hypothetical protein ACI8S6_004872 [Myxococcota bacterium]|jgi:hypothetical protein
MMNLLLLSVLGIGCNLGDGPLLPAGAPTGEGTAPQAVESVASRARLLRFSEPADRVAAADLDGDGVDTLLFVRDGVLYDESDELAVVGGLLQAVARGDIDGDGDEEAVLGFGSGRGFRQAPAEVWVVHDDRVERVWSRDGARNQVTDLVVDGGRIFLATYASSKGVEGGWLEAGVFTAVDTVTMGASQRPLPEDSVIVGRLYGDEPRSDGDLQVRREGRILETLPSLRGVKSILVTQLDGDPEPEVLVGDGWHYQYGLRAEGHLRLLDGIDLEDARTIALLPESYSVERIELIRNPNPSRRSLLLTGARAVHQLRRDALGWQDVRLESVEETGNAVVAYLDDGPWALISGSPSTLVPLTP